MARSTTSSNPTPRQGAHLQVLPGGRSNAATARKLAPAAAPNAGPFVKWVGGKTRLLEQLDPLLPREIARYAEPFVGGGAMFFHLHGTGTLQHAALTDANLDVITAYQVIAGEVDLLIDALRLHERRYLRQDHDGRAAYFYQVRERHPVDVEMDAIERAARMLFLNRTCFNGLWRENKSGRFNTPHGRYARPQIVQAEKLRAAAGALDGVHIELRDFRRLPELVREQDLDFVYLDPPYHPISATSAFNAYAGGGFSARDQRELGEVCRELDRMGVRFMLSNSDCPLIREIYRGFEVDVVKAPRAVNCRGDRRGDVDEVVVRNTRRY